MYIVGGEEIEAIARVIRSGKLFRYGEEGQCATFEKRYAAYLGVHHFALSASGTAPGLVAGLTGMGVGPGDEVLIPAHTYMATATAVLAVGAIPVIVDVDETITISPRAIRAAVGPHTKGDHPRSHVGRDLRHGRDHGASPRAQSLRSRRLLPERGRVLQRPESSARSAMPGLSALITTRTSLAAKAAASPPATEDRGESAVRDRPAGSTGRARATASGRSPATAPGRRRSWARC